jgi:hypothetical protein
LTPTQPSSANYIFEGIDHIYGPTITQKFAFGNHQQETAQTHYLRFELLASRINSAAN